MRKSRQPDDAILSAMQPTLVCLHGWGGSKESFAELRAALAGVPIEVLAPDLPGFGAEPEPERPWTVDDYAAWAERWIAAHRREGGPLWLLGHSHGGRIAMKLAVRGNVRVDRLFLCAAAGIRHARHLKRIIGLTLAKGGKAALRVPGLRALEPYGKRLLYKLVRVHDYERASPVMRETLILVTREDFRGLIKRIEVPTDIFWGEDDRMTPVGDARLLHQQIPHSALHVYPGVRHAVHRDRAAEIAGRLRALAEA